MNNSHKHQSYTDKAAEVVLITDGDYSDHLLLESRTYDACLCHFCNIRTCKVNGREYA